MPKRTILPDTQKFEFCVYARDNKRTRPEFVKWIEENWGSKAITVPELELALKKFILIYQYRTILSDAMIIKKAKLLADELEVSENKLYFSSREARSVDENVITVSLPLLQSKCSEYPLDHIYNIDKTGLFYW
ncbi:3576_t:CDS:2 [Dentiscutata erythropus]|uniref:3576_t:CDS:1 n=1 Tax=Dentiscutata erythropus TaxID=1348616 RepID=A0A9N9IZ99_9GLOM|nr:3576_t:CDS:2 [Dentiscutata erythropus]